MKSVISVSSPRLGLPGATEEMLRKIIVNLDLKDYTSPARTLQEQLDAEAVGRFDDQIPRFVDAGLKAVAAERTRS